MSPSGDDYDEEAEAEAAYDRADDMVRVTVAVDALDASDNPGVDEVERSRFKFGYGDLFLCVRQNGGMRCDIKVLAEKDKLVI